MVECFTQDGDYDLYYDWHRALDQVECLLYDCLGKPMPLLSPSIQMTKTTTTTTHWKFTTTRGANAMGGASKVCRMCVVHVWSQGRATTTTTTTKATKCNSFEISC
jgi:hypothetical protein